MMYRRAAAAAMILTAFCFARAHADDLPPDQPSADDVKKLVDDGKYRDALKDLLHILELKGPAAAPYDHYDMLMLKAECQLQLRLMPAAITTYQGARQEALTENKPDRLALPSAMAELLTHAPTYQYKPRMIDEGPPVSILDKTLRKAALNALLGDELPPVKTKIALLPKVTTMGPVLDAAKVVGTLRALEVAATGDTAQTGDLIGAVRDQATKLMQGAVDDMQAHADLIQKNANQVITENVPQYDMTNGKSWLQQVTHHKGPTSADRQTLSDMIATSTKIEAATKQVAEALGTEFDSMAAIANKADAVKKEAAEILQADYSQPVSK